MTILIISTTVKNKDDAKFLSNLIIEKKLAVCIQYYKVKSIYRWENSTEKHKEYRIEVKTINKYKDSIIQFIKDNHNYDIPEILTVVKNVENQDYYTWMKNNIGE